MRLYNETKLDFSDVLLVPSAPMDERSTVESRADVDLLVDSGSVNPSLLMPIIAANMDGVGTFKMAKELAKYFMLTCLVKHYELDDLVNHFSESAGEYSIYSLGTRPEDLIKFGAFRKALVKRREQDLPVFGPYAYCVDVANGYTNFFVNFISMMRKDFPDITIMAGNVCTPAGTERLIRAGADIIKVGIGPGSVCTTRSQTGVGFPQLSAVDESKERSSGLLTHKGKAPLIISDGGCQNPGDIAKAFAAGADFVMLGGMLAAHEEGLGDYFRTGEKVRFYGMASKSAQAKHNGGLTNYRASEGKEVEVPYRGPVLNTVHDILGGLRSACTLTGCSSISELKKVSMIRVNNQINRVFG